jgi:hypothetical protein
VFVVLHVIVIDEHIGAPELIEEAEPREIPGLEHDDGNVSGPRHRLSVTRGKTPPAPAPRIVDLACEHEASDSK